MCIKRGPRKKLARPSPRGAHGGIPHHSLLSELFSIHPRAFGFASAKPKIELLAAVPAASSAASAAASANA
jgi:hypothetical protein